MRAFNMEVSTKKEIDGKNQYVPVGSVVVYYPLLSELGIGVSPAKYFKMVEGKEVESKEDDADAFPSYSDERVQYVFDSVLASVKAQARNRLVSNTATLKEGLSIASTVEELLESGSNNKGEALANIREAGKAFAAFVKLPNKEGKARSEKLQSVLVSFFSSPKSVITGDSKMVGRLEKAISSFVDSLNDEQASKYSRHLAKLLEAVELNKSLNEDDDTDD